MAAKDNAQKTTLSLKNPEDVELLAKSFHEENKELFQMLTKKLIVYSSSGNALYIGWMAQSLIGLLKQANSLCEKQLSPGKMN